MRKTITIIKKGEDNIAEIFKNGIKTDMLFCEQQRDTVGKSGSNPTWGHVYSNINGRLEYNGIAIHKEYDYDFPKAAYAEKAWSICGKELLEDYGIRVPEIEVVEQNTGDEETISYRLMNNEEEDMIHIKDTLFNKFERDEIKAKKDIFTIEEILECVKLQIGNMKNYKKIERDMIRVLLLDSITNNGDRHALNWSLVRNKKTNEYNLAVFDHSSAFVDMFENKSFVLRNGWSSTYITVGNESQRYTIGSNGNVVVEYICKQYPEYFEEFYKDFNNKLPNILELIEKENMKIDFRRLTTKMEEKRRFFKKLIYREELEYGE